MKKILFALLAIATLQNCTKVINPDLNEASSKIVIEAELLAGTQDFNVKITKTTDFFNPGTPPTVNDATVFLKKGSDAPLALTNDGNGVYSLKNFTATESTTYLLTVTAEGKTYEATDAMQKTVPLDSLTADVPEANPFGGAKADSFEVVLHYAEPQADVNFYRIKSSVDGIPHDEGDKLLVIDDRLTSSYITIPIFTDAYELNDTVDVELVSMSRAMFDYFNTLTLLVGGQDSPAPANPTTNWSGGALGYFGAFAVSRGTIVVK